MDAKLFFSTFLLIFLAELGDKTQLAAMARAAGSGGKWTVFAAASVALVLSTLIAVLFGHVLTRFVPEKVIKIAAGALFVAFGAIILFNALRRPVEAPVEAMPEHPGIMARVLLRTASRFEEAAALDYDALARDARDPAARRLLTTLAAEEREHLAMVRDAAETHHEVTLEEISESQLPSDEHLAPDVAASEEPVLQHAIEHEEAMAGFYRELAALTPLAPLKQTFVFLASAEEDHARRLRALVT